MTTKIPRLIYVCPFVRLMTVGAPSTNSLICTGIMSLVDTGVQVSTSASLELAATGTWHVVSRDRLFKLNVSVLYCYDYLLTLEEEGRFFWNRRASPTALLFFVNRYITLINRLIRLISLLPLNRGHQKQSQTVCSCFYFIAIMVLTY